MNVISKRGLMDEAKKHRETILTLQRLYRTVRNAKWRRLQDVCEQYPAADQVGSVLIFDVLGGNYRLITTVNYSRQTIFIKALLTHKEYNRKEWMKWA